MKKIIYAMLALLLVGFAACNPDDDTQPTPEDTNPQTTSSMTITIDHKMGSSDMVYNQAVTLPSEETVEIKRLAYLLGNFYVVDAQGNKVILDDQYALIEPHRDRTSFTMQDIPFGEYTAVGFSIGLDSNTNHGNPNQYDSEHPLAPINNSLHWNWTGGYIFTAIEGRVIDNNETFVFHLAGAQNRLDFELEASFATTATDASKTARVSYDVNEIFTNPEVYSIAEDGSSSHSVTSPETVKLIRNMADVFTDLTITQ